MKILRFGEYNVNEEKLNLDETAELIDDSKDHHGVEDSKETEEDEKDLEEWLKEEDDELDEKADPMVVTPKDEMRISDIIRKGGGDYSAKAQSLTRQMANSIKDHFKALRRARAAERAHWHEMAEIFYKKALELGASKAEVKAATVSSGHAPIVGSPGA